MKTDLVLNIVAVVLMFAVLPLFIKWASRKRKEEKLVTAQRERLRREIITAYTRRVSKDARKLRGIRRDVDLIREGSI